MDNITENGKSLFEIITQLEDARRSFDGIGNVVDSAMIDDELEVYERAEWLLRDSIGMLKKLIGHPEKTSGQVNSKS
jgi:hypothetical protein